MTHTNEKATKGEDREAKPKLVPGRSGGESALILAAGTGNASAVAVLLERNPKVNYQNGKGKTALMEAAGVSFTIVNMLLKHGADPKTADLDGTTALHFAGAAGQAKAVLILAEVHCNINAITNAGRTALMAACEAGRTPCVEILLQHGAHVNAKNVNSSTALHLAVAQSHDATVKALLKGKGATATLNVNLQDHRGWTPLMIAAQISDHGMVKKLLDAGADVEVVCRQDTGESWTAITFAAQTGSPRVIRLLLSAGASTKKVPNWRGPGGQTAVAVASENNNTTAAELLGLRGPACRPEVEEADELRWGIAPKRYRDAYRWMATSIAESRLTETNTSDRSKSPEFTDVKNKAKAAAEAKHDHGGGHGGHGGGGGGDLGGRGGAGGSFSFAMVNIAEKRRIKQRESNLNLMLPGVAEDDHSGGGTSSPSPKRRISRLATAISKDSLLPGGSLVAKLKGKQAAAKIPEHLKHPLGGGLPHVLALAERPYTVAVLTMLANSFAMSIDPSHESEAGDCLKMLKRGARKCLQAIPGGLHELADSQGVDRALAGVAAEFELGPHGGGGGVGFVRNHDRDVAKVVRLFKHRRDEALKDAAVHADPYTYCYGTVPEIHPELTAHDVYVTAACIVSNYLTDHIVKHRPKLVPCYESDDCQAKVIYRKALTISAIEEHLALHAQQGSETPWTELPDLVAVDVVADIPEDHAEFVYHVSDSVGDDLDAAPPPTNNMQRKQRLSQQSAPLKVNPNLAGGRKDKELTAVWVSNTMDDPDTLVKRQTWHIHYHPAGMRYSDMVGGIRQVERDRHEAYNDTGSDKRDSVSPRMVVVDKPMNPAMILSMEKAMKANPMASPYAWAGAIRFLSTHSLQDRALSFPLKCSLYLKEFFLYAQLTESMLKIQQATSIFALSREFASFGNNPDLAFSPAKAKAATEYVEAARKRNEEIGSFGKTIKRKGGGDSVSPPKRAPQRSRSDKKADKSQSIARRQHSIILPRIGKKIGNGTAKIKMSKKYNNGVRHAKLEHAKAQGGDLASFPGDEGRGGGGGGGGEGGNGLSTLEENVSGMILTA